MFSYGAVRAALLTKAEHQSFFRFARLRSSTNALTSCFAVLDGFENSVSGYLTLHFVQSRKQTDQHRSELPESTGVHQTIKRADVYALFLQQVKTVDHLSLGSTDTRQGSHNDLVPFHHCIECRLQLVSFVLRGTCADDLLEHSSAACVFQRLDMDF